MVSSEAYCALPDVGVRIDLNPDVLQDGVQESPQLGKTGHLYSIPRAFPFTSGYSEPACVLQVWAGKGDAPATGQSDFE